MKYRWLCWAGESAGCTFTRLAVHAGADGVQSLADSGTGLSHHKLEITPNCAGYKWVYKCALFVEVKDF